VLEEACTTGSPSKDHSRCSLVGDITEGPSGRKVEKLFIKEVTSREGNDTCNVRSGGKKRRLRDSLRITGITGKNYRTNFNLSRGLVTDSLEKRTRAPRSTQSPKVFQK